MLLQKGLNWGGASPLEATRGAGTETVEERGLAITNAAWNALGNGSREGKFPVIDIVLGKEFFTFAQRNGLNATGEDVPDNTFFWGGTLPGNPKMGHRKQEAKRGSEGTLQIPDKVQRATPGGASHTTHSAPPGGYPLAKLKTCQPTPDSERHRSVTKECQYPWTPKLRASGVELSAFNSASITQQGWCAYLEVGGHLPQHSHPDQPWRQAAARPGVVRRRPELPSAQLGDAALEAPVRLRVDLHPVVRPALEVDVRPHHGPTGPNALHLPPPPPKHTPTCALGTCLMLSKYVVQQFLG